VRIGPVAFWTCVGTLVIMAGWSAVSATYFAFHDDVLTQLIARQAEMQFAYEDRIAEMRGQVDRVTSRQLLDQDSSSVGSTSSSSGRPRSKRAPPRSARWPIRRHPAHQAERAQPGRRRFAGRPAQTIPISDKAVFTARRIAKPASNCAVRRPRRAAVRGPRPAAAWRARSRACRIRSTGSRRARHGRSTRSRKATTPRSSACAACWPSWGLGRTSEPPSGGRSCPTGSRPPPTRSSGKSTASAWRGAQADSSPAP